MPGSNICWGLEVGAYAIKGVKLEATGEGACKVLDFAVMPHPKVLSTPGVDANDVIRVSLGQFTNQVDLGKSQVAISVPGHSSFARFAKLPPVEPKKISGIVEFEARQQIPFPLDQVEWDYQTFVTPDSPDIEVGIFAITKERVNERLQMLADLGITPNFVVLSPIAVYNALAYDLDFAADTPGTIIVDIGTTSTDLVIATPGRMWVRTFPLGGHNFTEALVQQFQLSYPKAEKLKREAQDTKHARQVFQAMRPVFTDLAQDIQRSIGYFQSVNRDAHLSRIIGVGSTWRLPGLRKYLKQQLGMDVYRIEQFKKINMGGAIAAPTAEDSDEGSPRQEIDPNDRGAAFVDSSLSLATAYGLALQGLELNAVSGNLMPISVIRRSMWKEKVRWFGMAAGIAAAAAGVMFVNPVMAYLNVNGPRGTKPAIVDEAVSKAAELKRQAEEAGLLGTETADLRAANLAVLQDKRELYNLLISDVQSIFASAQERSGAWAEVVQAPGQPAAAIPEGAALVLASLNTQYSPPQAVEAAEGGAEAALPQREGRVTRGPTRGPVAAVGDSAGFGPATESGVVNTNVPPSIRQFPVIAVEMEVTTPMPEPRRFLEVVGKWLREHNGTRSGDLYEVHFADDFTFTPIATLDSAPGGPEPAPGAGQPRARPDPSRPTGRAPRGPRAPMAGGGDRDERGPAARSGGDGAAPAADLEVLAPLGDATAKTPPPTGSGTFRWYLVLKPAQPAAEAAPQQPAAGGAQ